MTEAQQESSGGGEGEKSNGPVEKVAGWFDDRIGLHYELMRPAQQYVINPFYWIGALAVVAFVTQGVTGILLTFYYIPTPADAYPSTQYIFQDVSYGRFLETIHLYGAYSMILLAFMHMMRGYFVSVYKAPRELMWLTGMTMGFVTLGFGFTGYLLPWTVVSKAATDVGTGMIGALPPQLSSLITYLLVGPGDTSTQLLRFYDIHVIILPSVLLLLLFFKMYMLEAHGISRPQNGEAHLTENKKRWVPFIPDMSVYVLELAAIFDATLLLISAVFPVTLPPEYSAAAAAAIATQPDWYFLWIYQLLKISAMEQAGLPIALSVITLIFVGLLILPFVDRGKERAISRRMKFVTLGVIFVAEVLVLTVWGELTPGQIISNESAALVLGGTALLSALGSWVAYRLIFHTLTQKSAASMPAGTGSMPGRSFKLMTASLWTAASFVTILTVGTVSISGTFNALGAIMTNGISADQLWSLGASLLGLGIAAAGTVYLIYRLDLPTGAIKRRVKLLEIGWRDAYE